jgi:hypothetical protein
MTARAQLDSHSADRLRKLCGMLGSQHDGERAAAAAKADAFVRSLGLSWGDVIGPPIIPEQPVRIRQWLLRPKDREFVRSMANWRGEPTEHQREWLLDLYAQLHRGAGR